MEYRKDFPSIEAMVDYVETTPQAGKWKGSTQCNYGEDDPTWTFGVDLDGAYKISRQGWQEGRERFRNQIIDAKSYCKGSHV